MFFQHDTDTGRYEDLAYGQGWTGPSLEYRKVEKLEKDPLFWAWLSNERFRRVAERVYEGAAGVALYRAFLMNKHAGGGTDLPWHQDGGNFWGLDRDPVLQIWTALDDAPLDGGCLEVVDGTHLAGLATQLGGVVPKDHVERADAESRRAEAPGGGGRGRPHPQPSLASLRADEPRATAAGAERLLHGRGDPVPAEEARAAELRSGLVIGSGAAPRIRRLFRGRRRSRGTVSGT